MAANTMNALLRALRAYDRANEKLETHDRTDREQKAVEEAELRFRGAFTDAVREVLATDPDMEV